jgi:hypothetical protein
VIEGVNQAMLEVEDQDRALAFWTERIEFEVVQDAPYGEDGAGSRCARETRP